MSLRDELLKLGRQRGYLNFAEINDALPADASPDEVADLLKLLEDNGIEVRGDEEPDPQIARTYRTATSPEVEAWLLNLGVEASGCVGRFDSAGGLFEAEFTVPIERAIDSWRRLRAEVASSGLWPILCGWAARSSRRLRLPGEITLRSGDTLEFIDTEQCQRAIQQTLAESGDDGQRVVAGPVDPATLPDFCAIDEYVPAGSPVVVQLVAAPSPWAALAARPIRPDEEWMPTPARQVAVVRSWWHRFGAELFVHRFRAFALLVARTPQTDAEARQLADEVDDNFAVGTPVSVAGHRRANALADLRTSHLWWFGWE